MRVSGDKKRRDRRKAVQLLGMISQFGINMMVPIFLCFFAGRLLDKHFGKVGTPRRDDFERSVAESVHAYKLGEAIKKARLQQNLTQEQLGERIGVQRAQISRLEKGYSISLPTMSRVFQALGVTTATLDLGETVGKVALW